MIRLVVCNQRGGVSKTTTTHTIGRHLADNGLKVLMIDTDPQGSLALVLGAKPKKYLYEFVVHNHAFEECVWHVSENIDLLCSNRETTKAEVALLGMTAGELAFVRIFGMIEDPYDAVLIDVSPSINLVQTCSIMYAKHLLIPVAMDMLSLQGAAACIETSKMLTDLFKTEIKTVGLLPTMIDRRFNLTSLTLKALEGMSEKYGIPVLPPIRTDGTVPKAERSRRFLVDLDPHCKAAEDYRVASTKLMELLNVKPRYNAQEEISA
jgi:chromosome partitioning protein